jgi:TonB family protein
VIKHRYMWSKWAQLCPQDRSRSAVGLYVFTAAFTQNMRPPSFDQDKLKQSFEALAKVYNDERQVAAACVRELNTRVGEALPGRDRESPCPQPAPRTSGKAAPQMAKSVSPARLYPPIERRYDIQGRTVVRLQIDAQGCMRRAEIERSSGSAGLDDAALAGSELLEFLPAEKDGQATSAYTRLEWVFHLE